MVLLPGQQDGDARCVVRGEGGAQLAEALAVLQAPAQVGVGDRAAFTVVPPWAFTWSAQAW
jgi:hypothetical protein